MAAELQLILDEYQRMRNFIKNPGAHFVNLGVVKVGIPPHLNSFESGLDLSDFEDPDASSNSSDTKEATCIVVGDYPFSSVPSNPNKPRFWLKSDEQGWRGSDTFDEFSLTTPLSQQEIQKLIKRAQKAQFGNVASGETLTDDKVRKGLDINVSNMGLYDFLHSRYICCLLGSIVHKHLFPNTYRFQIKPYKINIYQDGDFFAPHKDSPIPSSLLATIVMLLPTEHEGGDLVFIHDSQTISLKKHPHSNMMQLAAFMTDITHTVLPVTKGVRITLSFKVMMADKEYNYIDSLLLDNIQTITSSLNTNKKVVALDEDEDPFGIVLSHSYTWDNLTPETLKGKDRMIYEYYLGLGGVARIDLWPVVIQESTDGSRKEIYDNQVYLARKQDVDNATQLFKSGNDISLSQKNSFNPYSEVDIMDTMQFYRAHSLLGDSDYSRKGEFLKIHEKHKSGAEYTGNESDPGSWECIYYTAVMVVLSKQILNNKHARSPELMERYSSDTEEANMAANTPSDDGAAEAKSLAETEIVEQEEEEEEKETHYFKSK